MDVDKTFTTGSYGHDLVSATRALALFVDRPAPRAAQLDSGFAAAGWEWRLRRGVRDLLHSVLLSRWRFAAPSGAVPYCCVGRLARQAFFVSGRPKVRVLFGLGMTIPAVSLRRGGRAWCRWLLYGPRLFRSNFRGWRLARFHLADFRLAY